MRLPLPKSAVSTLGGETEGPAAGGPDGTTDGPEGRGESAGVVRELGEERADGSGEAGGVEMGSGEMGAVGGDGGSTTVGSRIIPTNQETIYAKYMLYKNIYTYRNKKPQSKQEKKKVIM